MSTVFSEPAHRRLDHLTCIRVSTETADSKSNGSHWQDTHSAYNREKIV